MNDRFLFFVLPLGMLLALLFLAVLLVWKRRSGKMKTATEIMKESRTPQEKHGDSRKRPDTKTNRGTCGECGKGER